MSQDLNRPLVQPPFLQAGDTIRVIAPAGVIDAAKTKAGLALWKSQGYHLILGEHIYEKDRRFAGTDVHRLHDLQEAMDDPTCKAIIAVRGGYGAVHLVDKLDFSKFKKQPKWFVGFSDITVLHEEFQKQGYQSIHGPMIASSIVDNEPSESFKYLLQMLSGKRPIYAFAAHPFNRAGKVEGELIGGNLSIIYSMLGDTSLLPTAGKILFIEDIGEQLYHLDRMMYSLKKSGKLNQLKGLLVGEFTEMKDTGNMRQSVEEIIKHVVDDYHFPLYFNFPAGHGNQNFPLMLGGKYRIETTGETVKLQLID